MSRDVLLFIAVFLACAVEGVEAVTIVLAAGITRGWRSAWTGVATALVALAAIVAVLGPALTALPINVLRVVVGGLLLVFGLQWLRKAILRASGFKALHDEDAIFAEEVAELIVAGEEKPGIDPFGFTVSFKGVLLEGLEVAFIVVTFGSNQHNVPLAVIAAVAAVIMVVAAGAIAHAPLSRVPENTLKYAVGVMLTSFGIFWGAEGAGASWPGSDAAIPAIIALVLASSIGLAAVLRRKHARMTAVAVAIDA
jgi:Predicted membrane protein